MATITFKAKIQTMYNADETVAYLFVSVPTFTRKHCDMASFRKHPKFSGIANSDLFPNALSRIKNDLTRNGLFNLSKLPDNVTIDDSGFLASVTVSL